MTFQHPVCHDSLCDVFGGSVLKDAKPDETRPCTCGYRKYRAQRRPIRPLGMSEEDFLRTLKIEP